MRRHFLIHYTVSTRFHLEAVLETILCFLVFLASIRPSLPLNCSLLLLTVGSPVRLPQARPSSAHPLPTTPRLSDSLSYRSLYVTSSLLRVCCLALTHHVSAWLRAFHLPPSAVNVQNMFFFRSTVSKWDDGRPSTLPRTTS